MKRIVITDEDKKRYEDKANEKQAIRLLNRVQRKKKAQSECPEPSCRRKYYPLIAAANGHDGYCTKFCAGGGIRTTKKKDRYLRKITERKVRQERRHKRKVCAQDFHSSKEWRELRYITLRRYGFKCMACGSAPPNVVLHVDHIKPRSKYPELALELSNLQVLCEDCNLGKSNHTEDDLRPEPDFLTDAARNG